MADIFKKLNKVAKVKGIKSIKNLPLNVNFAILKVKRVNTKFSTTAILVELSDFIIFLPSRFNEITTEELDEINKHASTATINLVVQKTDNEQHEIHFVNGNVQEADSKQQDIEFVNNVPEGDKKQEEEIQFVFSN